MMSEPSEWFMITDEETSELHRNQFWQAIWVWNTKPNVVNRQLFSSKIQFSYECGSSISIHDVINGIDDISHYVTSYDSENILIERLKNKFPIQPCELKETKQFSDKCYIFVKKLFFKKLNHPDVFEICYINYLNDEILHYPIHDPTKTGNVHPSIFQFVVQLSDNKINLKIKTGSRKSIKYEWLKFLLIPKLFKWAQEAKPHEFFEEKANSLHLIAVDEYNELYSVWKLKYGKKLIENWTENTDPLKFVYEDIAIAVYLCLLWAKKKVNFVDLGCGNGLLVYILTEEGHKGRGIDMRSRKIWSHYPPSTVLEVGTITPEENCYFLDADWIIGNHSDELTPWIPIFAARSSYNCKFFLLPCCAYEFSGQRFQRKNSGVSVYTDYVEYVKTICTSLGFYLLVDKLRIPSTKRICLIGDGRIYNNADYPEILNEKINAVLVPGSINKTNAQFAPRESIEKVRNCTKVDRTITTKISDTISKILIDRQIDMIEKNKNSTGDIWCEDYSLTFEEAVFRLDAEDLKKLKNECGGLQTLLRNNHSVYLIRNSRICFRKPVEKHNLAKWKNRPCWFFHNHPLRCPLPDNKCSFVH